MLLSRTPIGGGRSISGFKVVGQASAVVFQGLRSSMPRPAFPFHRRSSWLCLCLFFSSFISSSLLLHSFSLLSSPLSLLLLHVCSSLPLANFPPRSYPRSPFLHSPLLPASLSLVHNGPPAKGSSQSGGQSDGRRCRRAPGRQRHRLSRLR